MQKKAAKSGFDWPGIQDAVDKVAEEADELRSALDGQGDRRRSWATCSSAAVCVSRFLETDPEDVLQRACDKFAARFRRVEELAGPAGAAPWGRWPSVSSRPCGPRRNNRA